LSEAPLVVVVVVRGTMFMTNSRNSDSVGVVKNKTGVVEEAEI
jgi:hypothetical protein